jgi:hypothetical protein
MPPNRKDLTHGQFSRSSLRTISLVVRHRTFKIYRLGEFLKKVPIYD